jgi:hypothetical protein
MAKGPLKWVELCWNRRSEGGILTVGLEKHRPVVPKKATRAFVSAACGEDGETTRLH